MKQFWQENKGSISIFAILSIIAVLMILFMSINIGNIYAKKNLVEDTAKALAPIVLDRQLDPKDTLTPQQYAVTIQDSAGLTGAEVPTITFGVFNQDHATLPNGFYPFGDPNTGVNTPVDSQDPDLNNVTLNDYEHQDFAVQITVIKNVAPLGNILTFSNISLQGTGRAATKISKIDIDPPENDYCCCLQAEHLNPEYTSANFLMGCWYRKTGTLMPPLMCFLGVTNFCDDYYDCRGRFFENLFQGKLFSSFLDQFKCWIDDVKDRIQKVKDTIRSVSEKDWNG